MKKLITHLFIGIAIMASFQANAQYCGSSQITFAQCGLPSGLGFGSLDSIPCIQSGANTTLIIPFTNYTMFTAAGNTVHVRRLKIDSMENLPCGLCWSTNKADNSFFGGESGCIKVQGTTTDAAGQYKIRMSLDVNTVDTSTNYGILDINADAGAVYLFIRVQNGGVCAGVDTSAGSQRLIASCDTFRLAIRDISNQLRDLTIQPNPMSNEAKVTFTSENGGNQQIRITSIVGSEVYNTTINSKPGVNETTINRNNLPAGIYLLSVGSNRGTVTRKFIISE